MHDWQSRLSSRPDNLESIHARAVGSARAPRWDMRQFNGQLFVALVGQFQGFARALHDDATDWLRGQGEIAALVANQAVVNRNGVAHEDLRSLESAGAGDPADRAEPTLSSYRVHRSALDALAVEMDRLVGIHLATLVGTRRPW